MKIASNHSQDNCCSHGHGIGNSFSGDSLLTANFESGLFLGSFTPLFTFEWEQILLESHDH